MRFRIVFWDVLPCKIIVDQGWWRQYAPLKRRSTIILHGSTTQKTALNNTSEMSVYFCETTRRHVTEGCSLHTRSPGTWSLIFLIWLNGKTWQHCTELDCWGRKQCAGIRERKSSFPPSLSVVVSVQSGRREIFYPCHWCRSEGQKSNSGWVNCSALCFGVTSRLI